MNEKKYEYIIRISSADDLHLINTSIFVIKCNFSKKELRKSYKKSVFKTGIDFENCLVMKDRKVFNPGEYRMTIIEPELSELFKKNNIDLEKYAKKKVLKNLKIKNNIDLNSNYIYVFPEHKNFAKLILDFIKLFSEFQYELNECENEINCQDIPHIGSDDKGWILFN